MIFEEHTYSVLIVSATEKFSDVLKALLPPSQFYPVKVVTSIASAKRTVLDRHFDLVLVNAPLKDDFGARFAIDVCGGKTSVCAMFVKAEIHDEIFAKVKNSGVFTLPKPTSSQMICQSLFWMTATHERLKSNEQKTSSIEDKMAEIRLINRAKWLLIEEKDMTEEEAHHYIEKQAMDRCMTKKAIAEEIIKEEEI